MINILLRGKTTDKRRPVAGLHESKPVGLTGTSNKKMSSNIEIKAKVGDPGRACWLAEAISDTCPARIHFVFVEGLGSFVELEVVLQDPESTDEGHAIARKLMDRLEIKDCDLVGGSYVDLLPNSSTAETVHCRKDP